MTSPEKGSNDAFEFIGAKAALFNAGRLLTYLRDDQTGLPWPGMWDLPGGGREGNESPEQCLLRELEEEFGLCLTGERLTCRRIWPSMAGGALPGVFFAGDLTDADIAAIHFGDEGQSWQMMPVQAFLAHPRAIPELCLRVWAVLAQRG